MSKSADEPQNSQTSSARVLEYARPVKRRGWRLLIIALAVFGAPALFAAIVLHRRAAERMTVASNLKEIGLAMLMYSNAERCGGYSPDFVKASISRSASNLRLIGLAMELYANEHNDVFPDGFSTIVAADQLTPNVFVSPLSEDTPATGATIQTLLAKFAEPGHCSYVYCGAGVSDTGDPTIVTAYDPSTESAGGLNVLFLDGHVEFVPSPASQQLLAALVVGPAAWTSTGGTTRPEIHPTTAP